MEYKTELKKSLKIYCDNTDKHNNQALWEYIINKAEELNIKGATVYKAVAGIGSTKTVHRFDLLNLSITLPIVIEIIDSQENIEKLLDSLDIEVDDIYATISDVMVLVK